MKTNVAGSEPLQASKTGYPKLIAHWTLNGDCCDSAGGHDGQPRGVTFVEGRDGTPRGAARFDGLEAVIEVPDHEELHLGTREFSVAFWTKVEEDVQSFTGDIFVKYDSGRRKGLNLGIVQSAAGYSGLSDVKNLFFGIDNGIVGSWADCGRPWKSNPLVGALAVYKNGLYVGLADASKPEDACHVFRYDGRTEWIDCGRLGANPTTTTAFSLATHKGHLYAGTGIWDWERARAGLGGPNHVYRYEGGTKWIDCGQFGNGYRVMSLCSFKGDLYAADDMLKVYRYGGDRIWTFCGQVAPDRERLVNCLTVFRGDLYASTHPGIYRYKGGTQWESIGHGPSGSTQIHKLAVYDGHLFAGTWPLGSVVRYDGDGHWTDCGELGIPTERVKINEVNDLTVYNGKLYAGVIPRAEIYRYEGGREPYLPSNEWIRLRSLVTRQIDPGDIHSWFRVPGQAVYQGRLFQGTSTCYGSYDPNAPAEAGRVYAMEAGKAVSLDDDLGSGWKHVAAVRERDHLKLYVNGELKSTSARFDGSDYDITCRSPLLIGLGAQTTFRGLLDDIQLFDAALTGDQVVQLYREQANRK